MRLEIEATSAYLSASGLPPFPRAAPRSHANVRGQIYSPNKAISVDQIFDGLRNINTGGTAAIVKKIIAADHLHPSAPVS